jgi:Ureidoglycolate lyase
MSEEARRITPVPLTGDGWAPFGWLPVPDTDPRDGDHRLQFTWQDVHVNLIGHRRDEVSQVAGGLRCDVLFRHATHTQVVMPLDVAAVVVVAPAAVPMQTPSDVDQVEAFVLDTLQPIVLDRGTWHWGPYPIGSASVELFNVQGLRYAEDNDSVDLTALGTPLDILID